MLSIVIVACLFGATEAQAGKFFHRHRTTQRTYTYSQPGYSYGTFRQNGPGGYVQASYATTGDPSGFTNWLNGIRASYGLRPVGYDPNLEAWGQTNNGHQHSRGMGHHVMGPARRQNSAMGSYSQIGAMWMASPAHQAALLDPTITRIGLAGSGAYWTFNAN
jgi:uncharacterized protein YkwD